MSRGRQKTFRKRHVNRNYKDSLFCMLFGGKEAALELYNAINHSNYQNPEDLEITTIEGAIYMGVKNDLSFLIDSVMNLYEAQSTRNPNMPLRGLIYFAKVYQGYIEKRGLDVYSRSRVRIPVPQYIVFYNGMEEEPDCQEYRLSDAFERQQERYCLECVATVLNINVGHNRELMENCSLLWQYAVLVSRVRQYLEMYPDNLEEAVDIAVEECIEQDILVDFLRKHRGEVMDVILTEYNEERHIKNEKRLSFEEGVEVGIERGIERGIEQGMERGIEQGMERGLEQGIETGIRVFIADKKEEGTERDIIVERLQKCFGLEKEKAEEYYRKFSENTK